MIETLIALACLQGSQDACTNGVAAYYQYSGLQDMVSARSQEIAEKHPNMSRLAVVIAAATQGQAVVVLNRDQSLTFSTIQNTISLRSSF